MGALQAILIAGMVVSILAFALTLPIGDMNERYGGDANLSTIRAFDKLNTTDDLIGEYKGQVLNESKVSTTASDASFLSNAFTAGKFIVSGGPFSVANELVLKFVNVMGIPNQVYIFMVGIIMVFLLTAVITRVLGR